MALVFKLEDAQAEALTQAINNLSDNLAKWEGEQTSVLEAGFKSLIALFGGEDPEQVQSRINAFAADVKAVREKLQTSIDSQTQGE